MSSRPRFSLLALILLVLGGGCCPESFGQTVATPRVTLEHPSIVDQDDMCIWLHPTTPFKSTIITSDKEADALFVYDLQGQTVQYFPVPGKPGNIDVRYGFPLGGDLVDIVSYNDRDNLKVVVLVVDPVSRRLTRVDNGLIRTGESYGGCLYRSPTTKKLYAYTASERGHIAQYLLFEEDGVVAGDLVRSWNLGSRTEGCVCDDETGIIYLGEEDRGIWKTGAEPGDPAPGVLIAEVEDSSGLDSDVEGLTLYYAAGGAGYLIASSQGSSSYNVYDRQPPHEFLTSFSVSGVTNTDGLDVTNVALGPEFPNGVFVVHNDSPPAKSVEVCAYEDLGLQIDTAYWNPRGPITTAAPGVAGDPLRADLELFPSHPNPFRRSTAIRYITARTTDVRLTVHDVHGRLIATLVEGVREAGGHQAIWNGFTQIGERVPGGVYLMTLEAAGHKLTTKTVLIP